MTNLKFTQEQFASYEAHREAGVDGEYFDCLWWELFGVFGDPTNEELLKLQISFLSEYAVYQNRQIKEARKELFYKKIQIKWLAIQTSMLFWIADVFNVQDPLVEKLRAERDNTNLIKNFKF